MCFLLRNREAILQVKSCSTSQVMLTFNMLDFGLAMTMILHNWSILILEIL